MSTPEPPAGPGFEIRPVAPTEVDQAGDVVLAAYRALPGTVLSDGYDTNLRNVRARTSGATVLVAVDGDRVLGCVTLVVDPASPWSESLVAGEVGIRMLGVDPAAAGRGVGTALVAECLARGRAAGARRAVLHTTRDMAVAHRIYQRAGFQRTPARDVVLPEFHLMAYTLELA